MRSGNIMLKLCFYKRHILTSLVHSALLPGTTHAHTAHLHHTHTRIKKIRRVAIIFSSRVAFRKHDYYIVSEGRSLILTGTIGPHAITLCNLYSPTSSHVRYLEKTLLRLSRTPREYIIFAGNFNMPLPPFTDRHSLTT